MKEDMNIRRSAVEWRNTKDHIGKRCISQVEGATVKQKEQQSSIQSGNQKKIWRTTSEIISVCLLWTIEIEDSKREAINDMTFNWREEGRRRGEQLIVRRSKYDKTCVRGCMNQIQRRCGIVCIEVYDQLSERNSEYVIQTDKGGRVVWGQVEAYLWSRCFLQL